MATTLEYRNNGLIATCLFHILLLGLLLFMAFATPSNYEASIIVDFGDSDHGLGNLDPRMSEPAPAIPQQTSAARGEQENLTQDYEETVVLPDNSTERPVDTPRETQRDTPMETTQPVEQPQQQVDRAPDQRALYPGRSDASSSNNQGITDGQGNQGSTAGAPNVHVYGEGIEVGGGLAGRGVIGNMPSPSYNVNDYGVVVVSITVNRDGNVIRAEAGARGTTTPNITLHEAAVRAARQTKFARNSDAPIEQTGTITYTFKLQGE